MLGTFELTSADNGKIQNMSDDLHRSQIRIPTDLAVSLQKSAKDNKRSFNAELTARLQASFNETRTSEMQAFRKTIEDEILAMIALRKVRRLDQWHQSIGPVLWWRLPVDENPYIGIPGDEGRPGYHTHWTPLPDPML